MSLEVRRLYEGLFTDETFVWLLSAVNFAVLDEAGGRREPFAAHGAQKRFDSVVTSPVQHQLLAVPATLAAFAAHELGAMNIHVRGQVVAVAELFLALSARVQLVRVVQSFVDVQTSFRREPFVAHCTQMWPWLAVVWILSDIVRHAVNLGLHLKRTYVYDNNTHTEHWKFLSGGSKTVTCFSTHTVVGRLRARCTNKT